MKNYERVCPVCGTAAMPDATQCAQCGTLLLGVDLTLKQVEAPPPSAPATTDAPAGVRCPHADCGAENPPGSERCLYCDRPLALDASAVPMHAAGSADAVPPAPTFYRLPSALAEKFRIVEVLPAGGAEAEIMVLQGIASGVKVIAKLYRPGLLPKGEILERVSRAAFRHVVHLIAWGESDGIGYEVMEYCPAGSLRHLMTAVPPPGDTLRAILVELTEALADLHALDVIHRDLKPENVLVRRHEPLDLVLTDFGIASVAAATQVFTGLARTVKYGAPETLTGVLDRAADWWSLGMIVAELTGGRHPYDGLSDAVITHRLVTGEVDLAAVADRDWRKLCRGLLQRDPRLRWGAAEVRRWLVGDATLAEPVAAMPTTTSVHIPRPYRVEDIACTTPAELAVALATHWEAGRKDLARGQIADWIEHELRDDNLLRLVRDLADLRGATDDLRLLRLIRGLAPEMPPVWRGASLLVANLVAQAARAGQGDAAAAEWLISVLAQNVLRELPAARFPQEAVLATGWEAAHARFGALWLAAEDARTDWLARESSSGDAVDFDAMVFGNPTALALPPPARYYPPLLLALADAEHALRLRDSARSAILPHAEHAPWLVAMLDSDEATAWVVADRLAPLAQRAADDAKRRRRRAADADAAELNDMAVRANRLLAQLQTGRDLGVLAGRLERTAFAAAVQAILDLQEELNRRGLPPEMPLLRTLRRAEPILLRIQSRLDTWEHAANVGAIWRNPNLMQGTFGAILLLGLVLFVSGVGKWLLLGVPALAAAFVLWRWSRLKSLRDGVRDLCKTLPLRVPTTPVPGQT